MLIDVFDKHLRLLRDLLPFMRVIVGGGIEAENSLIALKGCHWTDRILFYSEDG